MLHVVRAVFVVLVALLGACEAGDRDGCELGARECAVWCEEADPSPHPEHVARCREQCAYELAECLEAAGQTEAYIIDTVFDILGILLE